MSSNFATQGSLDGFCGIYALTHLVAIKLAGEYDQIAQEVFFGILQALEKRGHLTAKKIGSAKDKDIGFEDIILAKAFNGITLKRRKSLKAIAFSEPRFQNSTYHKKPRRAFEEGCTFVVKSEGGRHWVAVTAIADDGRYLHYDPSPEDKLAKLSKIFWDQGVMVGSSKVVDQIR
jgi:hypothetical protein